MRQCLDEAMLQCYFDGELSPAQMESATLHLSSCVTCTAAARELEEENALLSEAFALEFSESVPTDRLRRRIDAAVAGIQIVRPVVHQPSAVSGFFSSLSNLLSFTPQRALGYAALMVVLAFGVIFGLVKFKNSSQNSIPQLASGGAQSNPNEVVANAPKTSVEPSIDKPVEVDNTNVIPRRIPVQYKPSTSNKLAAAPKAPAVKLLPGERSYLQTIAKLDSTIQEGKKNMRPALQAEYERNLAVVDRAIAATRNAAKNNPSDPDAADFMFAAYQSKVDLLNTIADARVYNRRD